MSMYYNPYNTSAYWGHAALPPVYYPGLPYYYPQAGQAGAPHSPHRRRVHEHVVPHRIDLNPFIDSDFRGTVDIALWNVRFPPQTISRGFDNGRRRIKFSQTHFSQPATRPPLPKMKIVIPEYEYTFVIEGGEHAVTLAEVFKGIFAALRVEFGEENWETLNEEEQMMMHEQRCARLAQEAPNYEFDSYVRQIDAHFERTIFGGLKQVGPAADMLWELKLSKPPKERRRT